MLTWSSYHDPDEAAWYEVDFTDRLGGDEITGVTVSLPKPAGLAVDDTDFTGTMARAKLSGGSAGYWARVLFRVQTATGTLDETVRLRIMTG